jgi:hypothetical protein
MSSCEPFCSWNIYHSHQLGDREKFLEGMYSQFAGAMSRQTFSCVESRHAQFGMGPQYQCFLMARLAVIDDMIAENELHLLRITPLAWLSNEKWTVFENIPTVFGPVKLRFKLVDNGKVLLVNFKHEFRNMPDRICLHIPPVSSLETVKFEDSIMKIGKQNIINVTGHNSI